MRLMCSGVVTPCRNPLCARVECQPGYVAPPVMDDFDRFLAGGTIPDTENAVTGSESVPQTTSEDESTYTLTGLSARDVERIACALRMMRRIYTRESSMYAEVSELGSRVIAARKGE